MAAAFCGLSLSPAPASQRGGAAAALAATVTSPSSTTTTEQIGQDYDRFSKKYDDLDGGPVASFLGLEDQRRRLIGQAKGKVLEVGVGTGLNLPYYQEVLSDIEGITAIDISAGMLREAESKAKSLGLLSSSSSSSTTIIQFHRMDVQDLSSIPDATFDTVIDTFSLCVFPDPASALREMARVVKPTTGRILLLENSRSSSSPALGLYQDLTATAIAKFGGKGCVYNQDVESLVRAASLEVLSSEPLVGGFFTRVVARRRP